MAEAEIEINGGIVVYELIGPDDGENVVITPVKPAIFTPGVVLGHEFAGTRPDGQPVVVNPIALSCGQCDACRRGFTNQCLTALAGCSGVARDGGMAEFAVADQRSIQLIPENVSVREAAWTEPLAVALRAVGLGRVRAGPPPGPRPDHHRPAHHRRATPGRS